MNLNKKQTTAIDVFLGSVMSDDRRNVVSFNRGRFIHAHNIKTLTGISYVHKTAERKELVSVSLVLGLVANEPILMKQNVENLFATFPSFFGQRATYVIDRYVEFSEGSVKAKAQHKATYVSKLRKYKTGEYYVWFNWYDFGLAIATISDENLDRSEFIRAIQRFFRKNFKHSFIE